MPSSLKAVLDKKGRQVYSIDPLASVMRAVETMNDKRVGIKHVDALSFLGTCDPNKRFDIIVLNVGDPVEVYVLRVDREKERIGLSRKRLLPDPWLTLTGSLSPGEVVEGTVTSVVDFGAFVALDDGIEGLVHISEFPQGAQSVGAVQPGSFVQVRVLRIDVQRRRIALSLRDWGEVQASPLDQTSW